MGTFIQMGHHSRNLLEEESLNFFKGAILSPVNEDKIHLEEQINEFQTNDFELIFDPQLYYPNSNRGQLSTWEYFPNDFDTADYSSKTWWNVLNENLFNVLDEIVPSAVCSPAFVPKNFTDSYYEMNNWIGEEFKGKIRRSRY